MSNPTNKGEAMIASETLIKAELVWQKGSKTPELAEMSTETRSAMESFIPKPSLSAQLAGILAATIREKDDEIEALKAEVAAEKELSEVLRHNMQKERERGNRAYADVDGFRAQYEQSRAELAEVNAQWAVTVNALKNKMDAIKKKTLATRNMIRSGKSGADVAESRAAMESFIVD